MEDREMRGCGIWGKSLVWSAVVALGLPAVLSLGCAGVQVSSGTSTFVYPPLSLGDMLKATYPCDQAVSGRVTLIGGKYSEPLSPGSPDQLTVTLLNQFVAFGDLDGDGNKDAATILTTQSRGSSVLYDLVAMANVSGAPQSRGSYRLGDRVRIKSVLIANGKILVDLYRQGSTDPVSDPKDHYRETYVVSGSVVERTEQTQVPR